MDPSEVLALAGLEQDRACAIVGGLRRCPIRLSRATQEFGAFLVDPRTGTGEIRISRHIADEAHVRETARHELAHQAAWERYGHMGHGPHWQTFALYLGCEPVACARHSVNPELTQLRQRYVITCRACGSTFTRQRRSKLIMRPSRFACARCGGALKVASIAEPDQRE